MVELARAGGEKKPVQLARVSEITAISRRYLEQLAIALKSHSLLRGVSGRHGGYLYAKPAASITVGDVLTAVNGPIRLATCVADPELCLRSEFCECRLIWMLIDRRINSILQEFTIADLLDPQLHDDLRGRLIDADGPCATEVAGQEIGPRGAPGCGLTK
jgi:Rrf2 family protein